MLIIGITGTIGAGKGTVVEYLVSQYGFHHYSVRSYLTKELDKQGKIANRDNLTELANRLRSENNSPSFIIEELYKDAKQTAQNAIIESIRTVGEIEKLKSLGNFYLLAVDADQKLRYHRITARKSETDKISFEKFQEDENREMNSDNPNNQNLKACIERADYLLKNDTNIDILKKQIDSVFSEINMHHP